MKTSYARALGEIAMAISNDVPKEICTTVEGVRWLVESHRKAQQALMELEKVRTYKLAVRGLVDEANAVGAATTLLLQAQK